MEALEELEYNRRPSWVPANLSEAVASQLYRFTVHLPNDTKHVIDMMHVAEIDYDVLEEELQHTPQTYVFWAAFYSEAKELVGILERAVKVRKGVVADALVEAAKAEGVKVPSEKVVLALVEKDEGLGKLEKALGRAQKNAGKLWHMLQALQMKSEHLRSLAGFKRQEQQIQKS